MNRFESELFNEIIEILLPGKVIAREKDEYGEIIIVQHREYRMLRFDGLYDQSKMCLRLPAHPVHHYIRAMLLAIAWREKGNVLILGLGGGCLLRALHAYDAGRVIEVVELRPRVVEMAGRYFSLPATDRIDIHTANAHDYLVREKCQRHALIFSDLYSAMSMDPLQGQEYFLRLCADALDDEGWLILNFLDIPYPGTDLYRALYQVFRSVFFCRTGSGNVVIYATKSPALFPVSRLKAQATSLCNGIFGELRGLIESIHRL